MRPGKAEMDSSLYGTAMHYIFEQVLSLDGVEALLKRQLPVRDSFKVSDFGFLYPHNLPPPFPYSC